MHKTTECEKVGIMVSLARDVPKAVMFGLLAAASIEPTVLCICSSSSTRTTAIPLCKGAAVSFCSPDVRLYNIPLDTTGHGNGITTLLDCR